MNLIIHLVFERLFDSNQVNLIFIKRNVLNNTLRQGQITPLSNNAIAQNYNDKGIITASIQILD